MGYIFDVSDAQKYRDTAVTRHSNPSKTGLFLVPRRAVRPAKKIHFPLHFFISETAVGFIKCAEVGDLTSANYQNKFVRSKVSGY